GEALFLRVSRTLLQSLKPGAAVLERGPSRPGAVPNPERALSTRQNVWRRNMNGQTDNRQTRPTGVFSPCARLPIGAPELWAGRIIRVVNRLVNSRGRPAPEESSW